MSVGEVDARAASSVPAAPRRAGLVLSLVVFAGPGLRTSLLGSLLVAEAAIGKACGLGDQALAILVESVVFGGLVATLVQPALGRAVGVRRLSVAASVAVVLMLASTFVLAPRLAPQSSTAWILFAGAAALGFASAVLSPVTQAMLCRASETNPAARHMLQTVWSAGQPAGFIVGSLAGGIGMELWDWPGAFAVPLVFAVLAALPLLFGRRLGLDIDEEEGGAASGSGELGVLLLAVAAFEVWSTLGSQHTWLGPWTLAALVMTVASIAAAVARLRRSEHPALSPAPYGVAGFTAAAIVLLLLQLPTTAEFEVLLLTDLAGTKPEALGDRAALGNIGQIAGTALAGVLMLRRRFGLALVGGLAITFVGLAAYVAYPWASGIAFISVTRIVVGFGTGLATPVLFVAALDRMPARLSTPAGTWLVLILIGGTEVGLALLDMVLGGVTRLTGSPLAGYVVVEAVQALLCLVVLVVAVVALRDGRIAVTQAPRKPSP